MLKYDRAALQELYDTRVEETSGLGLAAELIDLQDGHLAARADLSVHARIGGFVPGPAQLTLADGLAWLTVVAHLPPDSDAMTTDLAVQFINAAPLGEMTIHLWLRRLGSRRAVVAAQLCSPAVSRGPVSEVIAGFAPMPGAVGRPRSAAAAERAE